MNLLQRLTTTFSAKANALLDRYDDPGERLDYAYQLLIDQLGAARQAVTLLELAKQRLDAESARLEECTAGLQAEARRVVSAGRDDLAREALARCRVIRDGTASLAAEHDQITEEDDRFTYAVGLLESTLGVLAAKNEVLKGSYVANGVKVEIDEAVSKMRGDVANIRVAIARADARAAELHAQGERISALLKSAVLLDLASSPESIKKELDEARRSEDIERELAAMKRDR